MQADRVRSIGGAGGEDTGHGSVGVTARPGLQRVPVGLVQPRQQLDGVSGPDAFQRRGELLVEDQFGFRRALVGLARRILEIT